MKHDKWDVIFTVFNMKRLQSYGIYITISTELILSFISSSFKNVLKKMAL